MMGCDHEVIDGSLQTSDLCHAEKFGVTLL